MSTDTSFICPGCQRVLRIVSPVVAGSKIRCPACGTIFPPPVVDLRPVSPIRSLETAPAAPPRRITEEEAPWAVRPRRRADSDDYWDDDRPRPRRRRHKRTPVPLILGGIATLVVLLVVVVGGFIWPGFFVRGGGGSEGQLPPPASDATVALLKFMPPDPMAIGGVDLTRLQKKNQLDELLLRLPQQQGVLAVLPQGFGPLLKDAETIVAAQEQFQLGVVALRTKVPIMNETLVRELKAVERDIQGRKIFRIPAPEGDLCALLEAGGKVLVLSRTSEQDFVRLINEAKGPAGELRGMVDKISGAPVWGILQIKGMVRDGFQMGFNQGIQFGGGAQNAKDRRAIDAVRHTKAILGWLGSGERVTAHCGLVIPSADDAAWLRQEMNTQWNRDGKHQFRNAMQMQLGFRAPAHANLINAVLEDIANSFRASNRDNLLWMSATLSDNTTRQLVQLADGAALAGLANFGGPPAVGPPAVGPPQGKQVLRADGVLQFNDPPDAVRRVPHKVHVFPMTAGRTYDINLTSQWDNYLRLEDARSVQLAQDDDGGGFPNARIVFTAPRTEPHRIIVTSFGGETGPYTLTVHER
jgi:hypothetical protein